MNDDSTRSAIQNGIEEFSECFTPSIKSVVDFAKGIPGFTLLNQDDQLTLLKVGMMATRLSTDTVEGACGDDGYQAINSMQIFILFVLVGVEI